MGIAVSFDYAAWAIAYPQFTANASQAMVTGPILTLAQQYCRNDGGGPVTDATMQTQLLWLMVAHVAALFFGQNGDTPSALVGRLSSASEGSVSVSSEFPQQPPAAAWYNQTVYGAAYWVMMKPYRMGFYRPGALFAQFPSAGDRVW